MSPEETEESEPGESWGEVVVVADSSVEGPGHYALIRAAEWCVHPEEMSIWRGPRKPDESVKRDRLTEVSCRALLVDKRGFYTCTPLEGEPLFYPCSEITEELEDMVKEESMKVLNHYANERAAEVWSYIEGELMENFGKEVLAIATFGDATAVNGELDSNPKHPRGWVKTDRGGHIHDGGETDVDKDWLIDPISRELTKELKTRIDPWVVKQILDHLYPKNYITWSSDSGDGEVWVSKRALKEYEAEQERKTKEQRERRIREERERHHREAEERRAMIKKGGFPTPREWSPRGLLPGERDA